MDFVNEHIPEESPSISVRWNQGCESRFTVNRSNASVKCLTYVHNKKVSSKLNEDVRSVVLRHWHTSAQSVIKAILSECQLSRLGDRVSLKQPSLLGGGGCGSRSFTTANESAVVKQELNRASNRRKAANSSRDKGDVKQTAEDMSRILAIGDDDIDNGKAYVMDRIVPVLNTFSVIANRVHHGDLLKVLMKAINLILRVGASGPGEGGSGTADASEADDGYGGLIWTEADKKAMEVCLANVVERIRAKQEQDGLLLHVFCVGLIKDMLKTSKSTFDVVKNCVALGVPLFGLIRNQDPTMLLILAVKAHEAMLQAETKSAMTGMVKFQTLSLKHVASAAAGEKKDGSARMKLLFAYHKALSELLMDPKSESSWEVQVYALMAINECVKGLTDEGLTSAHGSQLQSLLEEKQSGLFTLCAMKTSLSKISLVGDLVDSFLMNHRSIRFVSLEILVNLYVFLKKNEKLMGTTCKKIVEILYERWLLETSAVVRPVFLNEAVLSAIEELIQGKQGNTTMSKGEIDAKVSIAAQEESNAVRKIREKRQAKYQVDQQNEIDSELQRMADTLIAVVDNPDGLQKLVQKRQIELWKQGILARRAKGESHKDDALLEAIDSFVGLNLVKVDPFSLSGAGENQEVVVIEVTESQSDPSSQAIEGMTYLKNEFLQLKESAMCVILGGSGSGKSLLLKKFEIEQLMGGTTAEKAIPILVRMAELKASESDSIGATVVDLDAFLQKQAVFREQRIDVSVLKASSSAKILLIDAFDEYSGPVFNIWNAFKLSEWVNTKVVVTSRLEIAHYFKEILSVPEGVNLVGLRAAGFSRNQLNELAKKYLHRGFDEQTNQSKQQQLLQEIDAIIDGSEEIARMLTLPMNAITFLKTFAILSSDENKQQGKTAAISSLSDSLELQELFYTSAFERDSLHLPRAAKDQSVRQQYVREYFSAYEQLAVVLFKANSLTISSVDLKKVLPVGVLSAELKSQLTSKEVQEVQVELKFVYDNTEILSVQDGRIGFVHSSLMEYFTARAMFREIERISDWSTVKSDDDVKKHLSALNCRYLMDTKQRTRGGATILMNLAKMLRKIVFSDAFNRSLYAESLEASHAIVQIILLSRGSHFGKLVDTAASNLLSALCATRASLTGLNLAHCSLSKAYLYNYKGSIDFTGADLSQAMIAGCSADLSRSVTDCAQTGEAGFLWQADSVYAFNVCAVSSRNAKDNSISVITGSSAALNSFTVKANAVQHNKNRRLYTGKITALIQMEQLPCTIVAQSKNVLLIDSNTLADVQVFKAHEQNIVGMAFDRQSGVLCTTASDNTVRFWKFYSKGSSASQQFFKQIKAAAKDAAGVHSKRINSVRACENLKVFASASDDKSVAIWNSSTGKNTIKVTLASCVKCLAFSESSGLLVTCTDKFTGLQVWKVLDDRMELVVDGIKNMLPFCNELKLSPDGRMLAAAYGSDKISLMKFDVQQEASATSAHEFEQFALIDSHKEGVTGFAFSSDSQVLVSTTFGRACHLWDVSKKEVAQIAKIASHSDPVKAVSSSTASDDIIVSASESQVILWKKENKNSKSTHVNHYVEYAQLVEKSYSRVYGVSCSTKVTAVGIRGDDGNSAVEFITDNSTLSSSRWQLNSAEGITAVAFSSAGKYFLVATKSFVAVVNANNHTDVCIRVEVEEEEESSNGIILGSCFIGEEFIAVAFKTKVEVFKVAVGGEAQAAKTLAVPVEVFAVAYCAVGKSLVVATADGLARVFQVNSNYRVTCTFQAEISSQLSFSKDGKLLAGVSAKDGLIRVWASASNFEVVQTIKMADTSSSGPAPSKPSPPAIRFANNHARQLVISQEGNVGFADIESSYELIQDISSHANSVSQCAFSADGLRLITLQSDSSVKIFGLDKYGGCALTSTMTLNAVAKSGQKFNVKSVAFTPDSKHFAAACSDGVCRVYEVAGVKMNLEQSVKCSDNEINALAVGRADEVDIVCTGDQGILRVFKQHRKASSTGRSNFSQTAVSENHSEAIKAICTAVEKLKNHNQLLIAVGYQSGEVAVFSFDGDKKLSRTALIPAGEEIGFVTGLRLAKNCSQLIVSTFTRTIVVYQKEGDSWKKHQTISGLAKEVSSVDVLERQLVVSLFNADCEIYERDDSRGDYVLKSRFAAHSGSITYSAVFDSANPGRIATCARDRLCKLWNISKATSSIVQVDTLSLPHAKEIETIFVNENATVVALIDKEGTLSFWDGESMTRLTGERALLYNKWAVGFNGNRVFVAEDKAIVEYAWDEKSKSLNSVDGYVHVGLLEPANKIKRMSEIRVIEVGQDRTLRLLIETSNGGVAFVNEVMEIKKVVDDVKSAAVDRQFAYLLKSKGSSMIQVIDLMTFEEVSTLQLDGAVASLAVSLVVAQGNKYIALLMHRQKAGVSAASVLLYENKNGSLAAVTSSQVSMRGDSLNEEPGVVTKVQAVAVEEYETLSQADKLEVIPMDVVSSKKGLVSRTIEARGVYIEYNDQGISVFSKHTPRNTISI